MRSDRDRTASTWAATARSATRLRYSCTGIEEGDYLLELPILCGWPSYFGAGEGAIGQLDLYQNDTHVRWTGEGEPLRPENAAEKNRYQDQLRLDQPLHLKNGNALRHRVQLRRRGDHHRPAETDSGQGEGPAGPPAGRPAVQLALCGTRRDPAAGRPGHAGLHVLQPRRAAADVHAADAGAGLPHGAARAGPDRDDHDRPRPERHAQLPVQAQRHRPRPLHADRQCAGRLPAGAAREILCEGPHRGPPPLHMPQRPGLGFLLCPARSRAKRRRPTPRGRR